VTARVGRPILLPPISEERVLIITTIDPVAAFENVLSCLLRPLENPKVVGRPLAFPPANERVAVRDLCLENQKTVWASNGFLLN
jgi:hypothetical protein